MNKEELKEHKIEKIIGSAEKLKKAEASPFLFTRIKSRISENQQIKKLVPVPKAALGLFTLLLLAVLNFYVIFNPSSEKRISQKEKNSSQVSETVIPTQSNPYLEILNSQ